jgi:hypothetical protein
VEIKSKNEEKILKHCKGAYQELPRKELEGQAFPCSARKVHYYREHFVLP